MKSISKLLTLCAFLGAAVGAHAAPVLFPNGNFSTPAGASWAEVSGGITYSYPTTGGNLDGFGVMDATNGQWAIWVANGNAPMSLASLGLAAGQTYTFKQDMKILAGTNIGGLKIESWSAGVISDTGNVYPTKIGSGSTWETYSFTYTIAAGATGIKIVPLWGPSSSVGFDNLLVENTPIVPPPVVPVVPNGDFEIPGGASWSFFQGGGQTVSYPATGGNPNGCAIIDSLGRGSYAVMVWNNNAPKTLASLGLTAGQTYTFTQDMKILAPAVGTPGRSIGGIKVDFIPGSTGDIYPSQIIGDGTTWQTYSFQIAIPLGVTQINVVPLWGPNSTVAYDNFKILLPVPPAPAQPSIIIGKMVNWTPTVTGNFYQPQESTDNLVWTNLGPAYLGTAVSAIFDPSSAAFYRVQEATPVVVEAALNGGFEDADPFDVATPELWTLFGNQVPVRTTAESHTGSACMRLKADGSATAAVSGLEQNVLNQGGSITPGSTYDFSFWKKQVSVGDGYVQEFRVVYLNSGGGELAGTAWTAMPTGNIGTWVQLTLPGQVAPPTAATALIQINGKTGAFAGSFGEVLVDDVSLQSTGAGTPSTIASSSEAAAEVSWLSLAGKSYQVRSSTDLSGWSPFGGVIAGNGSIKAVYDTPLVSKKFYQLGTQ